MNAWSWGRENRAIAVFLGGGLVTGFLSAFFGVGGGVVLVPFLLTIGLSAQRTAGTSLLAVILLGCAGVWAHARLGNVDWRAGLLLGVGGILGSQVGAQMVQHVSTDGFKRIFGVFLLILGAYMLLKK